MMQDEPIDRPDSQPFSSDATVAELQMMLSEADAADAPAIAERIASLLGESLDGSDSDTPGASP